MGKVVAPLSISYSALNKYLHPHCLALSRGLTNVQFTTMKIRILVLTLVSGQCLLDYVLCVSCVLHTDTYRSMIPLRKVLQVLLVSCESSSSSAAIKDNATGKQQQQQKGEESVGKRVSTIPLRSEKTARFIIRRSRPGLVTYNVVKTPLHTFGE